MRTKRNVIILICTGLFALITIFATSIISSGILSRRSIDGSYISTRVFSSTKPENVTILKFDARKGTFQQTNEAGNVSVEGKYEVYDDIIKLTEKSVKSGKEDRDTMYVDGDVIYFTEDISREEVAIADAMDCKVSFEIAGAILEFTFKPDGTYEDTIRLDSSKEPSASYGTYTREGDYLCLTSFDNVVNLKFFASKNKLIFKSYSKQ